LILPYCIVADSEVSAPTSGVQRMAVEELTRNGLRCFYSTLAQRPESFTQDDALLFYATVQAVFEQVAVIPFRFPTLLEAKPQLEEFLVGKAQDYTAALAELRDFVQMELRILPQSGEPVSSTSGKDYMTQRLKSKQALESAAGAARSAVADLCANWRQQETREALRCYALVARKNTAPFQEKMKAFATVEDVRVLVSGPWPATEFIE
jgi:Gas vesicle synthesis protein GvpL/GvpF